ncbi:MAG TPA: right-handed parallel beta-helix repeat-containing protein, partial [Fimbriimonas sp.]|nr:right-handed parallel beta-helix repeat-containing protein [Fimbriimonas sp.]
GQTEALYQAGDLSDMKNLGEVELGAHHFWVTSRLPIESIDDKQHLVKFKKRSVFRLSDDYSGQAAPYYLDNVSEALKQPCQWYWDRPSGRIYYVPRPGDHLTTFEARIPRLGPVVEIDGASNITLNGRFMGAEWDLPNDSSGDVQAAVAVPGALVLKDAVNCELTCSVFACGTYGIELMGACKNNRILNCFLGHLGAGGIKVGHGTSGTTVRDCMISDDGEVHASAVGIWIGNSGHNVVSHNLILDLGYTGISVGWTWGYGPSDAVDNVIENNLIANIGQGLLSDMGGIYTLGVSPGTIIRNNKIESVKAWGYGGWGIYLDEGSSHILVENNVVTNCKTGSFHQHYGQDNEIRNNIFMFAQQDGQIIRSRPEDHNSFTMENNIIEWRKTPLFGGNLQGPGFVFRSNLLWKTDGSPDLPAFVDKSNLVADPSFDPYPFGLPASSPAFKIGFKPIELDDFGPRQQHSTKGR